MNNLQKKLIGTRFSLSEFVVVLKTQYPWEKRKSGMDYSHDDTLCNIAVCSNRCNKQVALIITLCFWTITRSTTSTKATATGRSLVVRRLAGRESTAQRCSL